MIYSVNIMNNAFLFFQQISNEFLDLEDHIQGLLAPVPRISFTLDGWTSPFQDSFLAVLAHWINDDWNPKEILLGFELLTGKHDGRLLVDTFIMVLRRFNLQKKVMTITSDNGSNVLSMMRLFEEFTKKEENHTEW